jgi:hypothetical protein
MTRPIPSRAAPGQRETPWAGGLTVFAAVIMLVAGVWHALAGIAALVHDDVYVATPQYIYSFDLTGWGWAHLLLGILIAGAGVAVLQGQTWGRAVGIVLASLSLIANFLFIPYYPIWSLVIITLDVAIIWALTVYRREAA